MRWAPYLWLVYLPALFAAPVLDHARASVWMPTIGAALLFLPLYYYGYVMQGRREMYAIIAMIAALGYALIPVNGSAAVFVVYAAAFAGLLRPPRLAVTTIAALCAIVVVEARLAGVPSRQWAWELFFIVAMGAVNAHFAVVRETSAELRRAREQIAHFAVIAERERIGRDLHDLLGHTLSLITLKSALASRVAEDDPARAIAEIRDVEAISRDTLGQVRAAVAGYRDAGLQRELVSARQMLETADIALRGDVKHSTLTPAEEAVLALGLREAVTNVARHARASMCTVSLLESDAGRTLVVSDDGVGTRTREGNGLTGMRERVSALGGSVVIEPGQSGHGTTLRMTLPPVRLHTGGAV
ncbi:MAG: sensor histidine kinase [Gemmatimonadetes bacterium]|nr:sensor histidine kinase [Gemmatimonadota bacterium]